jgi:hypothetical protein
LRQQCFYASRDVPYGTPISYKANRMIGSEAPIGLRRHIQLEMSFKAPELPALERPLSSFIALHRCLVRAGNRRSDRHNKKVSYSCLYLLTLPVRECQV